MDKKAMYKLSYGLYVLSARDEAKDNACIINTAIQAASEPNQVSVCVNKLNFTHNMILKAGLFNVSVLSNTADYNLFKHFGFQSGRDIDKFRDFKDCKRGENGLYYITRGTNAYISVKVDKTLDLASHTLFVGKVTDMDVLNEAPSIIYDDYIENIKPDPNEAKPADTKKTIWRCRICGYEYVGEELPEDFICPRCKHPASDFEKVTR